MPKRAYRLSDAIRDEGVVFRILKHPARVKGGLGTGQAHMQARIYRRRDGGLGLACLADSWDHAYSASHEIADQRHGFRHSDMTFCEQANLLARWHRRRR
jgi:hypothetical protein